MLRFGGECILVVPPYNAEAVSPSVHLIYMSCGQHSQIYHHCATMFPLMYLGQRRNVHNRQRRICGPTTMGHGYDFCDIDFVATVVDFD
jgi:hypothetical protein